MEIECYRNALSSCSADIERIRQSAHALHASVNQHYDRVHPYSIHLDSVAEFVRQYAAEVIAQPSDVLPVMFGAFYHDSIEDARLTYNDVLQRAQQMMSADQALMATEIVYALTNEKGRTRSERADDRYYQGIRTTPYAPLCKFADRLANASYSAVHGTNKQRSMRDVYASENEHFMHAILGDTPPDDPRLRIPASMAQALIDTLS